MSNTTIPTRCSTLVYPTHMSDFEESLPGSLGLQVVLHLPSELTSPWMVHLNNAGSSWKQFITNVDVVQEDI